jgi:hypothetical protein
MNEKIKPYHVIDFPAERRGMPRFNNMYWGRHCVYGLLEVDVTLVNQFIQEYHVRTGELLSFSGYLAFCLARAVDENKMVQAYNKNDKQLVVSDDVDIGIMIERKIGEKNALMGHIIRGANGKTYRQIHQEIRSVQSEPMPVNRGIPSWLRSAVMLPWPFYSWFIGLLRLAVRRDPTILTSMAGTVGITAVGMFGKGMSGWGVAPLEHVLDLVVGGIARKPAVVEGRIEPREILDLTVVFDHDVIDGAPATRFTRRLVELIESGDGLHENHTITGIDTSKPSKL